MTDLSAPEEFAAALRVLYAAADSPTYTLLVHQAGKQLPPVKFAEQTLSDWLRGDSVPASPAAVRFLTAYLGALAARRGQQVRGVDWWVALHERARKTKQASRGGRPPARAPSTTPTATPRRLGRPIGACDPLLLEVHRAIEPPCQDASAAGLPPYVQRAHDARLREVVAAMAGGISQLVVLVGGSSTGKTRACWEAIQDLPRQWWLWHPIDPSRPDAAVQALAEVGPYTVVWLNEAQHYLLTPDPAVGERIAAGLRTLLADPARNPLLVLGTIWPQYWATLKIGRAHV